MGTTGGPTAAALPAARRRPSELSGPLAHLKGALRAANRPTDLDTAPSQPARPTRPASRAARGGQGRATPQRRSRFSLRGPSELGGLSRTRGPLQAAERPRDLQAHHQHQAKHEQQQREQRAEGALKGNRPTVKATPSGCTEHRSPGDRARWPSERQGGVVGTQELAHGGIEGHQATLQGDLATLVGRWRRRRGQSAQTKHGDVVIDLDA